MTSRRTPSRTTRRVAAMVAGLIVVLAACGGTSQDTATQPVGTQGGDAAAAAQARVAPLLEPQTKIPITGPLPKKVTAGKTVYWLEGNIQSIIPITKGFEEATKALGWNLKTVTYDPADPQGPSAAMRQAVDAKADYIAVSGQTVDILGQALDAAKDAKIPVIELFSTDPIGGESNGIYSNIGDPESSRASYPRLSDLIISDSGADAKVLFVNIPDFPILKVADEAARGQFSSACPNCQITPLDVSIGDLTSGAVASAVVSALQSNPDVEYVYLSIGDLAGGLPEALDAAGMGDKVKIVGNVPNADQVQSLIDGKAFAYAMLPRAYAAWAAVDAMARLDTGDTIEQRSHQVLPTEIWTATNVPKPAREYEGPKGYPEQFEALWSGS